MKFIVILIIACMLLFSSCGSNTTDNVSEINEDITSKVSASPSPSTTIDRSDEVVYIKEAMFVAQTNDIYINTDDYMGKTIKLEGLFETYCYPKTNETCYFVVRYGPGCCGYDANPGFEVVWDNEYPKVNDWVEAIGVLESYEEDGYNCLRLCLTSLKVLDKRGTEYVEH